MAEPAPLIGLPEAPVPSGGAAEWVTGHGGRRLRVARFAPSTPPRGSIVFSPGRTEPIEKYFEAVEEWVAQGFVVLVHDWRSQGLSDRLLPDGLRGHAAGGWKPYVADFRTVLDAFADRLPQPWIAIGHSMGGCLTLLALAEGEGRFAGAILSAPMLGIRLGRTPEPVARGLARLMTLAGRGGDYVPGALADALYERFDGNLLTHDTRRFARMTALMKAAPHLAVGGPTWGWLDFGLSATAHLAKPRILRRVKTPVTILIAGDDRIVDNAASIAAAKRLPQGELVEVPGALHEILMERDEMRNIFQKVLHALSRKVAPDAGKAEATAAPVATGPLETISAPVSPEPETPVAPAAAEDGSAEAAPAAKAAPRPRAPAKPKGKPAAAKPPAAKPPAAKPAAAKPARNAVAAKPKAAAKVSDGTAAKAPAKPRAPRTKKAPEA